MTLARLRVEADQIAHPTQKVNLAAGDDRRGTRTAGVRHGVADAERVFPDEFAVLGVQAKNALLAHRFRACKGVAGLRLTGIEDAIGDVDQSIGHRRASVAAADVLLPEHLGPAGRELVQNALLAPDAVALWPEPLWPIVGPGQPREPGQADQGEHGPGKCRSDRVHGGCLLDDRFRSCLSSHICCSELEGLLEVDGYSDCRAIELTKQGGSAKISL